MPRIPEVDPDDVSPRIKATFDAQTEMFGAPLKNHLLYAHDEDLFRAARGVWSGLDKAAAATGGEIDGALSALINRRVAARVGCVF